MNRELDILDLAAMNSRSELGTVAAVQSRIPPRYTKMSGGTDFFRFFWKANSDHIWQELPLHLRASSLWNRVISAWPPEELVQLDCDQNGVTALVLDHADFPDPESWLRLARYTFSARKWSVRRLRKWNRFSDEPLKFASRLLAPDEQLAIDAIYGNGLPRFSWLHF